MTNLVSLELDYGIKVSSRVHEYLSPDNVYFPIYKTSKILVKDKETVLKGQLILINGEEKIFSSVSGVIAGLKKIKLNNEDKTYLVIANNYKEKSIKKSSKKLLELKSKDELEKLLEENGVSLKIENKNILLLNAIDSEPYIVNDSMYLSKNVNSILEGLDNLKRILGLQKVIILLKNTETEILTKVNNMLGTYPDFRIVMVPNYYLIESKDNYKNYLDEDLEDIYELSINDYCVFNEILEKNKPLTEKYITITGDEVKNPLVINVKFGTKVINIIEEVIKFKNKNKVLVYYYNGLMKGYKTDISGLIVDKNFKGLVITSECKLKEETCINCGLCLNHCPLNINPIENLVNKKEIKCLDCGLCSYVCPSNINFKNITKKGDRDE